MKTQKMSFLKLLCFKNKFNLLSLDVICMVIAIIFSCILLQYAVVAPSQDVIQICENSLYEYIENPSGYSPPTNVHIILKENSISATVPQAFIYSVATPIDNQTYQYTTHIQFFSFLLYYFFGFVFRVFFLYISIEIILYFIITLLNNFLEISRKIQKYISKKLRKFKNTLECKHKQKIILDYENPKFKEIYQLGYNVGHADGLIEGSRLSKSDLDLYYQH